MRFDTDSPEFVRGFEAGRVYTLAQERDSEVVDEVVHENNAEMMSRIASATGRTLMTEGLEDGWMNVRLEPAKPEGVTPEAPPSKPSRGQQARLVAYAILEVLTGGVSLFRSKPSHPHPKP